jgi:hypothetical protein
MWQISLKSFNWRDPPTKCLLAQHLFTSHENLRKLLTRGESRLEGRSIPVMIVILIPDSLDRVRLPSDWPRASTARKPDSSTLQRITSTVSARPPIREAQLKIDGGGRSGTVHAGRKSQTSCSERLVRTSASGISPSWREWGHRAA